MRRRLSSAGSVDGVDTAQRRGAAGSEAAGTGTGGRGGLAVGPLAPRLFALARPLLWFGLCAGADAGVGSSFPVGLKPDLQMGQGRGAAGAVAGRRPGYS